MLQFVGKGRLRQWIITDHHTFTYIFLTLFVFPCHVIEIVRTINGDWCINYFMSSYPNTGIARKHSRMNKKIHLELRSIVVCSIIVILRYIPKFYILTTCRTDGSIEEYFLHNCNPKRTRKLKESLSAWENLDKIMKIFLKFVSNIWFNHLI